MAHEKLGHMNEEATRKSAAHLGIELTRGTLEPCLACSAAKAKQKNITKHAEEKSKATEIGERLFTDIATVKAPMGVKADKSGRPQWRIIVDEKSKMKFSGFFPKKSDMVEPTCEIFQKWISQGKPIKKIRLDNAGENKKLRERCQSSDWKLNLKFEFTARDTPQQNSLAETSLATIANKGRALMYNANIPFIIRYKLYDHAFHTATMLDSLVVENVNGKECSRYEHWYGRKPQFADHLRYWGEAGTVKVKTDTSPKMKDKGIQCMFVGYADDHDGDTYYMWNPKTKKILTTRDVIWMKQMLFKLPIEEIELGITWDEPIVDDAIIVGEGKRKRSNIRRDDDDDNSEVLSVIEENEKERSAEDDVTDEDIMNLVDLTQDDSDDEDDPQDDPPDDEEDNARQHTREPITLRSGKVVNRGFTSEIGAAGILTPEEVNYYSIMFKAEEQLTESNQYSCVGAGIGGGFSNTAELRPMKFGEAMQGKDKDKWMQAVREEHERMMKYKAWKPIKKAKVPKEAKILTTTWAMKKKANGTYRARLNARGFEQREGEHFDITDIASPVVNDITIRVVLVLMLMLNLCGHLMDVKGAFLNGKFRNGEVLYIYVPEGFEELLRRR